MRADEPVKKGRRFNVWIISAHGSWMWEQFVGTWSGRLPMWSSAACVYGGERTKTLCVLVLDLVHHGDGLHSEITGRNVDDTPGLGSIFCTRACPFGDLRSARPDRQQLQPENMERSVLLNQRASLLEARVLSERTRSTFFHAFPEHFSFPIASQRRQQPVKNRRDVDSRAKSLITGRSDSYGEKNFYGSCSKLRSASRVSEERQTCLLWFSSAFRPPPSSSLLMPASSLPPVEPEEEEEEEEEVAMACLFLLLYWLPIPTVAP
ncbi:hypothetical protein EYF80_043518 [Liparis tanakae]|uniref:Uncharacterized protein n=1 Tax=Liparis tanakae TaxID=230148 RepID=A0A4Z2FZH1_9TELE|nr:hypothetical protein EYF80_043518 [Liparis tanakae]